jgi:hypothetical protein
LTLPKPEENPSRRAANSVLLHSGAYVLNVRSAPVLDAHHFHRAGADFPDADEGNEGEVWRKKLRLFIRMNLK